MVRRQITQDELWALYRATGKAIWGLQYVEDTLHHLLALKTDIRTPGTVTAEQAAAILARHRADTLGTSLKKARTVGILDAALQARLDSFKSDRDWLVHRSLIENGDDLYDDLSRSAIIQRIEAFSAEAKALQHILSEAIRKFVLAHGADPKELDRRAEEMIRALRGDG